MNYPNEQLTDQLIYELTYHWTLFLSTLILMNIFFKLNFNIVMSSTPRSLKYSHSMTFSTQYFVCLSARCANEADSLLLSTT